MNEMRRREQMRRAVGISMLLGLLTGAVLAGRTVSAEAAPNLLLVTFDDMNADSAGHMGGRFGATPNLDAFASKAFVFERSQVTVPICQPCREALLTGRVPHRNGGLGFNPIRLDVPTMVEVLRDRGYFTAAVEKVAHMQPASKFPWSLTLSGAGKNPPKMRSSMEQCLKAAADSGKPFFINANITDPHRPFPGVALGPRQAARPNAQTAEPDHVYKPEEIAVPSFLEDLPNIRKEVAQYLTGVRRGDQSFRQIMEALSAAGRERDTVVLVMSDHGMSFPFSKATCYRNGTWSPFLLRWPGMPAPRRDRRNMVSSVDLMPTLLELLGAPAPEGMDGRSLTPLLRGEERAVREFAITHVNTVSSGKSFPQRCVRTLTHSYLWQGWPDGTPKFRVEAMGGLSFNALVEAAKTDERIRARVTQLQTGVHEQFFDLTKDPDERKNVIDDPAYRAERDRLRGILREHMTRTDDPELPNFQSTVKAD